MHFSLERLHDSLFRVMPIKFLALLPAENIDIDYSERDALPSLAPAARDCARTLLLI